MSLYGLLGEKLSHSYSPQIHEALGGGYDYCLFEVERDELESFIKKGDFDGLNVTIPYKEQVMHLCDELSTTAQVIGCVNTVIKRPDGTLYGHNTDAEGFATLIDGTGVKIRGKKAIVLGGGGSSKTVCHVLRECGARQVTVISRGGEDNYQNLARHYDADIIVNTTPVGMYPNVGEAPIDVACFTKCRLVLDLVYNPARTALMLQAQQQGIATAGGLEMLVGQARAAAELFSGKAISKQTQQSVVASIRFEMENVVLIGMPGSGKSSIGRVVAHALGRKFVDSDEEIVKLCGVDIPTIFEREGEVGFRAYETQVLSELCKRSGLVIATGGGCVTIPQNENILRQNSVVVYIKRHTSKLAKAGRPLSLSTSLDTMYRSRAPLYEKLCDVKVNNSVKSAAIGMALRRIKKHFGCRGM